MKLILALSFLLNAINVTYSPDSTKVAFTRDNDLWIASIKDSTETRLTFDGSETVYNGYASWVYYEEIFGRPSRYRAFWWSPDSKKLAFYRFDDTEVPMFPIYSPFGQDGTLRRTHYPKAGERNPEVRIGIADGTSIVWADFDASEDQYFGTPFWGADSESLFVSREPRIQNHLDLYSVNVKDGSKSLIYSETVETWLDWIDGMLFVEDGLYMVRSFETGWQQIYFLSYDGKTLRRLTDGPNWRISLFRVDKKGNVFFTAERDSRVRQSLYRVDRKGRIVTLTDPDYDVRKISLKEKTADVVLSNLNTEDFSTTVKLYPNRSEVYKASVRYAPSELSLPDVPSGPLPLTRPRVAMPTEALYTPEQIVTIVNDGLVLPGIMILPEGFDPGKKYPVHMDIYGGPDTPMVRDRWISPERYRWYRENGIIELIADCRAAGHNGREGMDQIYKQLSVKEVEDFCAWAEWLQGLPYVNPKKIGVEGFSFGGTMTVLLVAEHPDLFHYGIAGGGVYDWRLYDTHYTERFMSTPEDNPVGYERTAVLRRVSGYPTMSGSTPDSEGIYFSGRDPKNQIPSSSLLRHPTHVDSVRLKITHGTGDDNVHFQNTLQLIDVLQRQGSSFDLMIYPDGMHGYRGEQGKHSVEEDRAFWRKYLLSE